MKLEKREHIISISIIIYFISMILLTFFKSNEMSLTFTIMMTIILSLALMVCSYSYIRILLKSMRLRRKTYKKNRLTNLIMLFNNKENMYIYFSHMKKLPETKSLYDWWLTVKLYDFYFNSLM